MLYSWLSKHLYPSNFLSFQLFCPDERLLGICTGGFWIKADNEIRWYEGHSVSKISLVSLYLKLKAYVLLLSRGIMKDVK